MYQTEQHLDNEISVWTDISSAYPCSHTIISHQSTSSTSIPQSKQPSRLMPIQASDARYPTGGDQYDRDSGVCIHTSFCPILDNVILSRSPSLLPSPSARPVSQTNARLDSTHPPFLILLHLLLGSLDLVGLVDLVTWFLRTLVISSIHSIKRGTYRDLRDLRHPYQSSL
jgi:hypothetical protein